MAKTYSLVDRVIADHPTLKFSAADDYYWSPHTKTVHYTTPSSDTDQLMLLHEVAHALLDHRKFENDIQLLRIEREAWAHVKEVLAPRYQLAMDEDLQEDMLDTYRDWLHARSKCPGCSLTGLQTGDATYSCLACDGDWRVNDARRCALRRFAATT